jgi:hypothetical protein
MSEEQIARRLAAILAADVAGYSGMMSAERRYSRPARAHLDRENFADGDGRRTLCRAKRQGSGFPEILALVRHVLQPDHAGDGIAGPGSTRLQRDRVPAAPRNSHRNR